MDYAHTPDGLKNALSALKGVTENRLLCVFGCGGNRDCAKREIMGNVSAKLADFTVITTDNPRFEDPMTIIRSVEKGVLTETKNYIAIQDRRSAIEYAMKLAKKGDTLLIAGKGAEKYQEILGVKHPFTDKETVAEFLPKNS